MSLILRKNYLIISEENEPHYIEKVFVALLSFVMIEVDRLNELCNKQESNFSLSRVTSFAC